MEVLEAWKLQNVGGVDIPLPETRDSLEDILVTSMKNLHVTPRKSKTAVAELFNIVDGKIICDLCGASYKRMGNLIKHLEDKHKNIESEKYLKCEICSKVFETYHKLARHKQTAKKCMN